MRRQARLDRVLGQQALRKRVQRSDRSGVKLLERGSAPGSNVFAPGAATTARCVALELLADPVAQLGPGLVGEGDRGDGAQLGPAARDERENATHQGGRLA